MKFIRSLSLMLIPLFMGCASTMTISSDYERETDFSGYHTYAWLPIPEQKDPRLNSEILHSRITNAVEKTLSNRGFARQVSETPDFRIGYHVALRDKLSVGFVNDYYGYDHRGFSGNSSYSFATEYEEGTLILDIVDAKTNRLIWRGSASAEVSPSDSAKTREKRINEAVQRILSNYPPKA